MNNPSSVLVGRENLRHKIGTGERRTRRVLVDEVYLEAMFEAARIVCHIGPEFIATTSLTKGYD